jgi:lycopene cyclase domain-containing protein
MFSTLSTAMVFTVWDIFASANRHWFFSERFTLPLRVFGLPIEEYLFFITVGFASIFILVQNSPKPIFIGLKKRRSRSSELIVYTASFVLWIFGMLAAFSQSSNRSYTALACFACSITLLFAHGSGLLKQSAYWKTLAWGFGLFFFFNLFLTGLPIISYSASETVNVRILSIPVEDFLFNYALQTMLVFLYCFCLASTPAKLGEHSRK